MYSSQSTRSSQSFCFASVVSLNYRNGFPREIGCTLPRRTLPLDGPSMGRAGWGWWRRSITLENEEHPIPGGELRRLSRGHPHPTLPLEGPLKGEGFTLPFYEKLFTRHYTSSAAAARRRSRA